MRKVTLNTGAHMPSVGFGTWQIVPNFRAKAAVFNALDAGYRHIDTAKIYGNEKGVGAALRESGLARADLFVTTKLWKGDQGYKSAHTAFERSRRLLGLDYLDLYLIHWPGGSGDRKESWRAMAEIQAGGHAKAIGVSNFTIGHLRELKSHSAIIPAVNQIELHPYIYKEQIELLDYCHHEGIIVEAYSPLAHGLLKNRQLNKELLDTIGQTYGKSRAQVVLRWCLQHGTVPLPKTTSPGHMHENIDIFDFELSIDEMRRINGLSNGTRTCWDPNKIP